jgi:hypothetical protein
MKALITGRLTKAEFPDGTTALVGEIEVDCTICGQGTVILPGHHLKAIRDLLIAWCDMEPTLTGDDEHRQKISEQSFRGRVPPDPTRN